MAATALPARIIKRYGQVRFYDVDAASYVSVEQVIALVRAHEPIRVVDASTGLDVTGVVLAQVQSRSH
jgi:polyhydroxyalkanoate synthesis regulator protein